MWHQQASASAAALSASSALAPATCASAFSHPWTLPPLSPRQWAMLHRDVGGERFLRPRPKTSSERARGFRQREKAREEALVRQVYQLRQQVARLTLLKGVYAQKALLTRTSPCGSLVQLTRELYKVHRYGLETVDPMVTTMTATTEAQRAQQQSLLSRVQYKEDFLRKVFDPEVVRGDIVGVDAIIAQWRKHSSSYAKFEIEVGPVEAIVGSKKNPIVVIQTKMHARFGHDTFQVMFPFVRGRRDDLVEKFVDKDITLDCVSRFQFSEAGQVTTYSVEINFVEAFVKVLGDPRDVAELMQLSVIAPGATLSDAAAASSVQREEAVCRTGCSESVFEEQEEPCESVVPRSGKLSMQDLLNEESCST